MALVWTPEAQRTAPGVTVTAASRARTRDARFWRARAGVGGPSVNVAVGASGDDFARGCVVIDGSPARRVVAGRLQAHRATAHADVEAAPSLAAAARDPV